MTDAHTNTRNIHRVVHTTIQTHSASHHHLLNTLELQLYSFHTQRQMSLCFQVPNSGCITQKGWNNLSAKNALPHPSKPHPQPVTASHDQVDPDNAPQRSWGGAASASWHDVAASLVKRQLLSHVSCEACTLSVQIAHGCKPNLPFQRPLHAQSRIHKAAGVHKQPLHQHATSHARIYLCR